MQTITASATASTITASKIPTTTSTAALVALAKTRPMYPKKILGKEVFAKDLYNTIQSFGGLQNVITKRLFLRVREKMDIPATSSAGSRIRGIYEYYWPFLAVNVDKQKSTSTSTVQSKSKSKTKKRNASSSSSSALTSSSSKSKSKRQKKSSIDAIFGDGNSKTTLGSILNEMDSNSLELFRSETFINVSPTAGLGSLDLNKYLECRDHKKMLDVDDAPPPIEGDELNGFDFNGFCFQEYGTDYFKGRIISASIVDSPDDLSIHGRYAIFYTTVEGVIPISRLPIVRVIPVEFTMIDDFFRLIRSGEWQWCGRKNVEPTELEI